jgi:hypothetical protein
MVKRIVAELIGWAAAAGVLALLWLGAAVLYGLEAQP